MKYSDKLRIRDGRRNDWKFFKGGIMGKNPCFLFYPNDWERDLADCPWWVGGAWMLTLCKLYWEGGQATKTIKEWCKIVRENEKKTRHFFHFLDEKKIANVDVLDNQNITIICRRMKRDFEIRKVRQEAGKKGGNPKLVKSGPNLLNQNANQKPTLSVSVSVSDSNKHKTKRGFILPVWISKETWEAFREMRIRKRAPLTDRASLLIVKKLEKLRADGDNPEDVINQSIENGWAGIFPLKKGDNGRGARNSGGGPGLQTTPPEWTGTLSPLSEEQRLANLAKLRALGCGVDEG